MSTQPPENVPGKAKNIAFEEIFNSAMDAIMVLDAGHRIILFNPAAEQMFGYRESEVMAQPMDLLLPPRYRRAHDAQVEAFGRSGLTTRRMGGFAPVTGLRRNGEEFPCEVSIARHGVGAETTYSAILRDTTERARLENALRDLNEDLERRVAKRTAALEAANQELESFSYSVSHDLRAPLRAIEGFTRLIKQEHEAQLPPETMRLFERVHANVERMAELIDDLLTFSRTGKQSLDLKRTELRSIIEACLQGMRDEIAARGVEVRLGALPACKVDPSLMANVFQNLLGNALKYTRPRDKAVIEVGCEEDHGETVIFVRDNGVGFDMQYAGKLFGVFQRLHSATEFEGTGVGLAIVQRIVQRHGGRIWAEAKPDEGATFRFTLGAG